MKGVRWGTRIWEVTACLPIDSQRKLGTKHRMGELAAAIEESHLTVLVAIPKFRRTALCIEAAFQFDFLARVRLGPNLDADLRRNRRAEFVLYNGRNRSSVAHATSATFVPSGVSTAHSTNTLP